MKRSKHHVGRLRIKAADILNRQFPNWDVRPEDISPATGRWRTDWRLDVYRWELTTFDRAAKMPVVCGCWDTLTRFVKLASKYGCSINKDNEIFANESDLQPPDAGMGSGI